MARLASTEGLTEFQQEILDTVRGFVDKEILPYATDLEHKDEFPDAIVEGMKEMGLFGLMIPEEYGGLGESLLTYALVVEQVARGWMSVTGVINTHFIVAYMLMHHGTQEQKDRLLPQMATGELRGGFSMSEPGCGSDVAAITSRGVRDGEQYVLDGVAVEQQREIVREAAQRTRSARKQLARTADAARGAPPRVLAAPPASLDPAPEKGRAIDAAYDLEPYAAERW